MGYICTSCLREYDIQGLVKFNNNTNEYPTKYICPSIDCLYIDSVVEVDDFILPVIIELNKKGYITTFCCSGHYYQNIVNTYISFDSQTVPKIIPKGFIVEDKEYYSKNKWEWNENQICFRKYYENISEEQIHKELLQTSIDLVEWVRELPCIKE